MVTGRWRAAVRPRRGFAMIELVVAIGVVTAALIPLAFTFAHEQKVFRAEYYRAIAMEIVDGEMESLAAGEWRSYKPGAQPYAVRAESATNLPAGHFTLTLREKRLRLEWSPEKPGQGGAVWREVMLP